MDYTAHEPPSPGATPRPCSTPHSAPVGWLKPGAPADQPEAQPDNPPPAPVRGYAARHDGWTGEKMAVFCETLAETAVVAEACEAAHMGISGAYAARRRNPVFAAAWDAALTIARERLADTLLARSMEGNIEQIWRGGEVVGERHVLDNRLGLAILRRLDRLAETGATVSTRGERQPFPGAGRGPGQREAAASQRLGPGLRRETFDWEFAIGALRAGDDDAVAKALALAKSNEVEEVEDPPVSLNRPEDEGLDLSHRCWKDGIDDIWMTDFPPPEGFTGYESRAYDDVGNEDDYERVCTPEEVALLDGDKARARAVEREYDEALRDAWFELLRSEQQPDSCEEAAGDDVPDQSPEDTGFGTSGGPPSSPSASASASAS